MTSLTPLQESIATLIGWSLIHSLWLAAALVAVVQICLALLPKSTAQTRYALYLLALFSIPAGAISCAAILHDADSQPAIVHENVGVATDVSTPRVANDGPEPLAEVAQANVSSHFTTTSTESEALTVSRVGATVVRRRPTSPKIDPAAVPVGLANEASTSLADRGAVDAVDGVDLDGRRGRVIVASACWVFHTQQALVLWHASHLERNGQYRPGYLDPHAIDARGSSHAIDDGRRADQHRFLSPRDSLTSQHVNQSLGQRTRVDSGSRVCTCLPGRFPGQCVSDDCRGTDFLSPSRLVAFTPNTTGTRARL